MDAAELVALAGALRERGLGAVDCQIELGAVAGELSSAGSAPRPGARFLELGATV
ncbi:hypothetical protein [Sorangium sp. So ce887]|uniref:hypothetical protein n=1 Tax=Sorangium sp. So ce887 TaxID=3133324 RepID=UPI003F61954B